MNITILRGVCRNWALCWKHTLPSGTLLQSVYSLWYSQNRCVHLLNQQFSTFSAGFYKSSQGLYAVPSHIDQVPTMLTRKFEVTSSIHCIYTLGWTENSRPWQYVFLSFGSNYSPEIRLSWAVTLSSYFMYVSSQIPVALPYVTSASTVIPVYTVMSAVLVYTSHRRVVFHVTAVGMQTLRALPRFATLRLDSVSSVSITPLVPGAISVLQDSLGMPKDITALVQVKLYYKCKSQTFS